MLRRDMTPASRNDPASGTKDVDEYLARVPEEARATLVKIRTTIRAAVPKATEAISYGIPAFKLHGRPLVWYAAFKNHCSFFPISSAIREALGKELERYDTSKGTIRFPVNKPLPAALVRKLVKTRIAENEALAMSKRETRSSENGVRRATGRG
jgi:uncharacterized protein YdhG (YjbR/CyaY superfamily)